MHSQQLNLNIRKISRPWIRDEENMMIEDRNLGKDSCNYIE